MSDFRFLGCDLKVTFFWNVTPCILVHKYQLVEATIFVTLKFCWQHASYYTYRIPVIIIIIIIIIIISFMQGIYTYIPKTNYVPTEYSVAAILLLLFMVLISLVSVLNLLYFYISTFRSVCAVPNVAVFCSSFTSCFPYYYYYYYY